jgi:hypothetical protein
MGKIHHKIRMRLMLETDATWDGNLKNNIIDAHREMVDVAYLGNAHDFQLKSEACAARDFEALTTTSREGHDANFDVRRAECATQAAVYSTMR